MMGVVSRQAVDAAIATAYQERPWWLPRKFAWRMAVAIVSALTERGLLEP